MSAGTTEDDLARSGALLEAVGFHLVPLASPVAGIWELLAVSPRGLTLIASRREKPNLMGTTYGAPPGWPTSTVRLILVWGDGPCSPPSLFRPRSPMPRPLHEPGRPPGRHTYA